MKKIIFITLSFFCIKNLLAQDVFAPAGAVWYYNYEEWDFGSIKDKYVKIWYERDTLVQGKNCKLLKKSIMGIPFNDTILDYEMFKDEILYVNGDTVFRLADDSLFYELYRFNAQVGDTITSKVYLSSIQGDTIIQFKIYQTGSVWINGVEKRALSLYPINNELLMYHSITQISSQFNVIETLGGAEYMFPWTSHWLDVFMIDGIRCYSDDFLGSYNSGIAPSCEYVTSIDEVNIPEITLTPNPVQDFIYLDNEHNFLKYEIISITGQKLFDGKIMNSNIEISQLPNGIYLIKFFDAKEELYFAKFIKE